MPFASINPTNPRTVLMLAESTYILHATLQSRYSKQVPKYTSCKGVCSS